jgi:hypothetical protein
MLFSSSILAYSLLKISINSIYSRGSTSLGVFIVALSLIDFSIPIGIATI